MKYIFIINYTYFENNVGYEINKGTIFEVIDVTKYESGQPVALCYSDQFVFTPVKIPLDVLLFCTREYKEK